MLASAVVRQWCSGACVRVCLCYVTWKRATPGDERAKVSFVPMSHKKTTPIPPAEPVPYRKTHGKL